MEKNLAYFTKEVQKHLTGAERSWVIKSLRELYLEEDKERKEELKYIYGMTYGQFASMEERGTLTREEKADMDFMVATSYIYA